MEFKLIQSKNPLSPFPFANKTLLSLTIHHDKCVSTVVLQCLPYVSKERRPLVLINNNCPNVSNKERKISPKTCICYKDFYLYHLVTALVYRQPERWFGWIVIYVWHLFLYFSPGPALSLRLCLSALQPQWTQPPPDQRLHHQTGRAPGKHTLHFKRSIQNLNLNRSKKLIDRMCVYVRLRCARGHFWWTRPGGDW